MAIRVTSVGETLWGLYLPCVAKVRDRVPWSHLLHHRKRRIRKKAPAVIARKRKASLFDVVQRGQRWVVGIDPAKNGGSDG